MKRCVIFAAAPINNADYIKTSENDFIICADAGILHAKKLGITPDLALGDFDSCNKSETEGIPTVTFPSRKDDTDLMLAIKYGMEYGCEEFMIYGALGGDRFDHDIASISALGFLLDNNLSATLESDKARIKLLDVGEHRIEKIGKYMSLFPFGCDRALVCLEGTAYDGETLLMSSFPIGVSNEITDRFAKVTVLQGDSEIRVLLVQNKD